MNKTTEKELNEAEIEESEQEQQEGGIMQTLSKNRNYVIGAAALFVLALAAYMYQRGSSNETQQQNSSNQDSHRHDESSQSQANSAKSTLDNSTWSGWFWNKYSYVQAFENHIASQTAWRLFRVTLLFALAIGLRKLHHSKELIFGKLSEEHQAITDPNKQTVEAAVQRLTLNRKVLPFFAKYFVNKESKIAYAACGFLLFLALSNEFVKTLYIWTSSDNSK